MGDGSADDDGPMIDVVIVHYETPTILGRCIASVIDHADDLIGSIVVVDNSTTPSGRDGARAHASERVRLMTPETNVGYGAAANRGAALGDSTRLLVLNADTVLTPGAVRTMIAALDDHPEVGIVGPLLTDDAGVGHPSCAAFPTVWSTVVHQSGVWRWLPEHLGARAAPFFAPDRSMKVPWVLGAALAVDRAAFESVGGFDESYFLYFEEVDLSRRMADRGIATMFVAEATVRHVGGASTASNPLAAQRPMYRSLARYVSVHRPPRAMLGLRAAVVSIAAARLVRDLAVAWSRRDARAGRQAAGTWASIAADATRGWNQ